MDSPPKREYHLGLSPRGRGNHLVNIAGAATLRSIPAWAGEPLEMSDDVTLGPVYPRVGGGTGPMGALIALASGLSPRGRGNLYESGIGTLSTRSIPAWAGEPPISLPQARSQGVYPRVGGGTFRVLMRAWDRTGLSPRGRGNLDQVVAPTVGHRSIPAWAGEP